ncbi:MAG: hypothetical protein H6509_06755 [Bryobacterales bacterium]|nr:hypothetical protein [Bryobacterales bacterium]
MSVALLVVVGFLTWALTGCVTIGKGRRTLIRHASTDAELLRIFPQLVTDKTDKMVALTPKASTDETKYSQYLSQKYGTRQGAATLSLVVRDRTKMPPFLPVDVKLPAKLVDLYADTKEQLSLERRLDIEQLLTARLYNVPDLLARTTLHHNDTQGRKVYYSYPRIQIDFSSSLALPALTERFSYLGIAVKLNDALPDGTSDPIRFVDFWPKDADIVEYTRGKMTQATQLAAKTGFGDGATRKTGSESVLGAETDQVKDSAASEATRTLTSELSYTMSEDYVHELTDAFERRTTGVFDGGSLFLAEFRSIKNKRIGGTYTFDLELELPAKIQVQSGGKVYESQPIAKEINADVYLVAVVRHVHKRGMIGVRARAPEPENDHTYEQVIVREQKNVRLWNWGNLPWVEQDTIVEDEFLVKVFTNRGEARFIVRDTGSNAVLGAGSGSEAVVRVAPDATNPIQARVEFLEVAVENASGEAAVFTAAPSDVFSIPANKSGSVNVVGEYKRMP